ncbi:MAG TPA: acyltransferase, partial [Polyangia bacterium]
SWTSLAASVLYLRNIFGSGDGTGHLWSLSLEEQFYVTWPLLLFLAFRRRTRLAVALVVSMAVWRALAVHFRLVDESSGALYTRPWFRYDSILYGCLIALVLANRPDGWQRAVRLLHPVLTIPLLIAATTISPTSPLEPLSLTFQALLAAAATLSVVVCPPTSLVYRVLASSPLRLLGRISYALYLWQQPFIVIRTPPWRGMRELPINVLVALALAFASHYVVERPFLELKHRFSLRSEA